MLCKFFKISQYECFEMFIKDISELFHSISLIYLKKVSNAPFVCVCVFFKWSQIKNTQSWLQGCTKCFSISEWDCGLKRPLVFALETEVSLESLHHLSDRIRWVPAEMGLIKINMVLDVRWLISWLKRHMLTYISMAFIANCCVLHQAFQTGGTAAHFVKSTAQFIFENAASSIIYIL